ncbi:MAG: carboxypeptidase-like regulatory domain-containing protein [Bryobacteraceae bacterium]
MRSLTALAAFFCLAALPAPAAEHPTATLRVEVKDADGKPVERASVKVRWLESHSNAKLAKGTSNTWELRTNQEGVAKIPPIPQGKILIQVIAKGYQTFGQTYDITEEEKTIQLTLNPPQPQYSVYQ